MLFDELSINTRFEQVIRMAWEIFQCKVGNEFLTIYKEASMQLQFAYILQNLIPVFIYEKDEDIKIELEKTVKYNNISSEVDMFVTIKKGGNEYKIGIEMKCYRKIAASGKPRGAANIFMKDVYEDIVKLENYISNNICQNTFLLVMNDLENLVNPKKTDTKCWDYNVSNGFILNPKHLTTPVGGKNISIKINNQYKFNWTKFGSFYFLVL